MGFEQVITLPIMKFKSTNYKLIALALLFALGLSIMILLKLNDSGVFSSGVDILEVGKPAPDFTFPDLDGKMISLSGHKGKVVLVNIWATWCRPCIDEMPSMEKLYQRLNAKGFEILAVNLQEDRSSVKRFVDEYGLSFPVLLDTTGRIGATYGARSIPTTYIVDREGFVIAGTIGTREWDTEDYIRFFEKLLAE